MTEVAIRVDSLSKSYQIGTVQPVMLREALTSTVRSWFSGNGHGEPQTLWALKDVSFEVRRGEIVGILGRNGAGKSTLLKLLSRITAPTSGLAEIHGRVGALLEIGTGFHPELSGRENIYLNGAILGMRKATVDRKFDEMVAFSELESFLDTPVKHYSSGMYMRLAFAVAAHLDPEILLIDEILAVGDMTFQKKCLGKMGEVAREGRTVIFVSHNLAAIAALTQRSLVLQNGQKAFDGPTQDALKTYMLSAELHGESGAIGNALLRIHSIRIAPAKSSADQLAAPLLAVEGEPIQFDVDISVASALSNTAFFIKVVDLRDFIIYTGFSSEYGQPKNLEAGRHAITHVIDIPLSPGTYQVSVGLIAEGKGAVAEFDRLTHFQVLQREGEDRLYDNRGGVLRVRGEWNLTKLP